MFSWTSGHSRINPKQLAVRHSLLLLRSTCTSIRRLRCIRTIRAYIVQASASNVLRYRLFSRSDRISIYIQQRFRGILYGQHSRESPAVDWAGAEDNESAPESEWLLSVCRIGTLERHLILHGYYTYYLFLMR